MVAITHRAYQYRERIGMTKKELIEKLKRCHSGDEEIDHRDADDLLLEYINDPEVSEAYNEIDKWYA